MEVVNKYLEHSNADGRMSNFGKLYQMFSERLHSYFSLRNDQEVIICSSGHIALMTAMFLAHSPRCIIPDYTFVSTKSAATLQNIHADILDVDVDTGALSLEKLEEESKTAVDRPTICLVTPLSAIPPIKKYREIANTIFSKLIIDGAATFGTDINTIFPTYADYYCMSFHATKSFPLGEGGILICSQEEKADAEAFINFGLDPKTKKQVLWTGINGKVSEYTCAIGLALLDNIRPLLAIRKRNSSILLDRFSNTLSSMAGKDTIYQSFPFFAESKEQADNIISSLTESGYETIKYYKPLSYLKDETTNTVAMDLYNRSVCLPIHSSVTEENVNEMIGVISKWI
jgi:dTDP-4-amino-4,6-dideoxygalactose transaminase